MGIDRSPANQRSNALHSGTDVVTPIGWPSEMTVRHRLPHQHPHCSVSTTVSQSCHSRRAGTCRGTLHSLLPPDQRASYYRRLGCKRRVSCYVVRWAAKGGCTLPAVRPISARRVLCSWLPLVLRLWLPLVLRRRRRSSRLAPLVRHVCGVAPKNRIAGSVGCGGQMDQEGGYHLPLEVCSKQSGWLPWKSGFAPNKQRQHHPLSALMNDLLFGLDIVTNKRSRLPPVFFLALLSLLLSLFFLTRFIFIFIFEPRHLCFCFCSAIALPPPLLHPLILSSFLSSSLVPSSLVPSSPLPPALRHPPTCEQSLPAHLHLSRTCSPEIGLRPAVSPGAHAPVTLPWQAAAPSRPRVGLQCELYSSSPTRPQTDGAQIQGRGCFVGHRIRLLHRDLVCAQKEGVAGCKHQGWQGGRRGLRLSEECLVVVGNDLE